MFVQHHPLQAATQVQSILSTEDFDLQIQTKSQNKIQGKIFFEYLHQQFEANILITASNIEIQSHQPFAGIQASAPVVENKQNIEQVYLLNGSLTKAGSQNIIWLMLDLIHLYNLVRLKPGSILEIYREVYSIAKSKNDQLIFGQIHLGENDSKEVADLLAKKMKRKFKYEYGNSLDLLASVQQILNSYPQSFLVTKTILGNRKPVLS